MDLQTKALFSSYSYFDLLWRLLLSLQNSESCVVSSVYTNFLFNLWLSLAPKRLLFVSYKSPKRAAKYSLLHCYRKKPSVNFNNNYCAHAHSVPRVWKSSFVNPDNYYFNPGKPQCAQRMLTTYTTSVTLLINVWNSISFINSIYHHWLLFPLFLLFFCNTVDECMEFNLFIVHLFRNITLTMVVPIVVDSEGVISGARILCHIWQYRV